MSIEPFYLISPSEPPLLRSIGDTSPVAEKKGCDVLISLPNVRIGIQRKTWTDLVISLGDGRLAGSIPKMDMAVKVLIIEGEVKFDKAGHMVVRSRNAPHGSGGFLRLRHTRESLAGVAISLRYVHGLDVFYTESLFDTVATVLHLGGYFSKSDHKGVVGRRTYVKGSDGTGWGAATGEDRARALKVNLLMACGVGLKTAENLLKANGGKIPLAWTMSRDEMMEIDNIGDATADRILKVFE